MEHRIRKTDHKTMKPKKNTIKFVFIGDTMLGGEFIPFAEKRSIDLFSPFKHIEPYFTDADICLLNFEGPLAAGTEKRPGVSSILSNHPAILDFLKKQNKCVLNLANNHMMDYGDEGLKNTIEKLKNNKLPFFGAGFDGRQAKQEVIIECKGKRIAFAGFTSEEPFVGSIIAGAETAGCPSFLDLDELIEKVKALKSDNDIVCITLHWGNEFYSYPEPKQIKIAHSLVDAGCSYVIGHHPHVVQGIERYKRGVIFYSLGNFFLPAVRSVSGRIQPRKKISNEFIIVKSEIDDNGNITFKTIGGRVARNYILIPYPASKMDNFNNNIETLSGPILILDKYNEFWRKYSVNRESELRRENIKEAFEKGLNMPISELLGTFALADIKRNLQRITAFLK